jgi:putative inorganic carbon (HCO3(-)) transporter
MDTLAQIGGPLAALGIIGLLLGRDRKVRLIGLALASCGGGLAAVVFSPNTSLASFGIVAAIVLVLVGALVVALRRWSALLPILVLAFIPVRLPFKLSDSIYNSSFLLYLVVTAATLVLGLEIYRGDERSRELGPIAWPLAGFVVWSAVSLIWSIDVRRGATELDAALLPFTFLALALARVRWSRRLLQGLLVQLVSMALAFALVGAYQYATRDIFWNPKVINSNAYAPFFRINSVFWDPSIYGRFLVLAILACLALVLTHAGRTGLAVAVPALGVLWIGLVLSFARSYGTTFLTWAWWPFLVLAALACLALVATLARRPWLAVATGAIGALWIGLALSFSQSSFTALVVGVLAAALVAWRKRAAIPLLAASMLIVPIALVTPQARAKILDGPKTDLNSITSARSTLVEHGIRIAVRHPVIGVGVGGFRRAYADLTGMSGRDLRKAASHTTPVTVAAEGGVIGFALFLWLLASSLLVTFRRAGPTFSGRVQLICALALTAIAVQSLFYADFFEDPMTWGFLAIAVSAPFTLPSEKPVLSADALGTPPQ